MADNESRSGRGDDRPVAELIKDLSDQTTTLIRKEMELARAELTEKGKRAGLGAGMFGGAGVLGLYAFGALTAALIAVLATALDHVWLAALIVAAVYAAVAGVLALTGKKQVEQAVPPVPEQAAESVKEDVEWTKSRAQAARK
jgi:MFS family permease